MLVNKATNSLLGCSLIESFERSNPHLDPEEDVGEKIGEDEQEAPAAPVGEGKYL